MGKIKRQKGEKEAKGGSWNAERSCLSPETMVMKPSFRGHLFYFTSVCTLFLLLTHPNTNRTSPPPLVTPGLSSHRWMFFFFSRALILPCIRSVRTILSALLWAIDCIHFKKHLMLTRDIQVKLSWPRPLPVYIVYIKSKVWLNAIQFFFFFVIE